MNAPIVLFVYNRPSHTLKTLQSLFLNPQSQESKLYVFADGPKTEATDSEIDQINEVRTILESKMWCKEVEIIYSNKNKGLARSIIEGITYVFTKNDRVIVLEDDLDLSPGFLKYMNDALEYYLLENRVMHISGYMFPISTEELDSTFFYNVATCWGWGTWKSAWEKLILDTRTLFLELHEKQKFESFSSYGNGLFLSHLENNFLGHSQTWAIRWFASITINNGLCLHPKNSLINNIGHDGSGVNCNEETIFSHGHLAKEVNIHPIPLEENHSVIRRMKEFYNECPTDNLTIKQSIKKHFVNLGIRVVFDENINPVSTKEYKELKRIGNSPFMKKETIKIIGLENHIFLEKDHFLDNYKFWYKDIDIAGLFNKKDPLILDLSPRTGISGLAISKEYPAFKYIAFENDPVYISLLRTNCEGKVNLQLVEKEIIPRRFRDNLFSKKKHFNLNALDKWIGHEIDLLLVELSGVEAGQELQKILKYLTQLPKILIIRHVNSKQNDNLLSSLFLEEFESKKMPRAVYSKPWRISGAMDYIDRLQSNYYIAKKSIAT